MRSQIASLSRRENILAALAVIFFSLGALCARKVGIWVGIGGTVVLLATISILRGGAAPGLLRPGASRLLLGLLSGMVMTAATYLLFPLAARMLPWIPADVRRLYGAFQTLPLAVSVLVTIPIVVSEEILWRGLVQGVLARHLGRYRGAFLAALIYALAHLPLGSPALVAAALGCGIIWGGLRAGSGNLFAPLIAHLLWDATVLFFVPLQIPN